MIKVLLADDNKTSLDRLLGMVNWEEMGFEVAAVAENGIQALRCFDEHRPEVVITDVKMPGFSGIDVAQKIKELRPETVIIFLSNYEEFTYVRSAMDLGVFEYILKHEATSETLCDKLTAAKKMLVRQPERNKYYAENCIVSYLAEADAPGESTAAEELREIYPDSYDLLLLEQECFFPAISATLEIMTDRVKENLVKKVCYGTFPHVAGVVGVSEYQFLVLIESKNPVTELSYMIKEKLHEKLHKSFSILILDENTDSCQCLQAYLQKKELMRQRFFYPFSVVLNQALMEQTPPVSESLDIRSAENALNSHQIDALLMQIDQLYLKIVQQKDYYGFSSMVRLLLKLLLPYHQKVMNYKSGGLYHLFNEESQGYWFNANDIFYWLKQALMRLAQIWKNNDFYQYSPKVQTAVQYILSYYMDSALTVQDVAEVTGLGVNRLNTIMKEETGDTVWKYLTKVRVEQAKKLLDAGDHTVSEISPMIGYSTLSYFSRIFKKMTGVSPQKYKKRKDD